MLRFIGRRLLFVLVALLLASAIIFAATMVLPGDVATSVLGRFASEEAKAAFRHQMGLDRPVIAQYRTWLSGFVTGHWGTSYATGEEIAPLVFTRLLNSAILAAIALLFYVPLGIICGLLAAVRRNSWFDHSVSIGSLVVIGLPEFVIGLLLVSVFAVQLNWLPAVSAIEPGTGFLEALPYLILPALTVSLGELGYVLRMTRAGTITVLSTDYVRTATLKGLSPRSVLFTHVLRNSLLPTITIVAIGVGWLIGGLIVTESVFNYPGIGRLLLYGVQRHDIPLVQATSLLIVTVFMLVNVVADVLYAFLNPRIRYG